jgi:hypothetical protein
MGTSNFSMVKKGMHEQFFYGEKGHAGIPIQIVCGVTSASHNRKNNFLPKRGRYTWFI